MRLRRAASGSGVVSMSSLHPFSRSEHDQSLEPSSMLPSGTETWLYRCAALHTLQETYHLHSNQPQDSRPFHMRAEMLKAGAHVNIHTSVQHRLRTGLQKLDLQSHRHGRTES